MIHRIVLFGEAEKGEFHSPILFSSLAALADILGHPPEGSVGIHIAIQTLLFQNHVIYVRVKEEGFSVSDYMKGLKLLKQQEMTKNFAAICMPGVGNPEIIHEALNICEKENSLFMTRDQDLYDYLSCHRQYFS